MFLQMTAVDKTDISPIHTFSFKVVSPKKE